MIPLVSRKYVGFFLPRQVPSESCTRHDFQRIACSLRLQLGGYKRTEESNTLFAVQKRNPPFDIFSNLDVEVSARKVSS